MPLSVIRVMQHLIKLDVGEVQVDLEGKGLNIGGIVGFAKCDQGKIDDLKP